MKEYKICYIESGTVYTYCKAWVSAESEEEAKEALMKNDWSKILDSEGYDTEYGDDYKIIDIQIIEEVENEN